MMADRITLTNDVYMKLDGQWGIVLSGTVIDVPTAGNYSPPHYTLSATPAGTLGSHGGPTPVSNVRRR